MHKSMNLLAFNLFALKDKFEQELLNFLHIFDINVHWLCCLQDLMAK